MRRINCRHHVCTVQNKALCYYMRKKHLHVSWHIQSILRQQISTPFIWSPTPQSSDRSGLTWSLRSYCSCLEEESPRVPHIICFSLTLALSLFAQSYISCILSLINASQKYMNKQLAGNKCPSVQHRSHFFGVPFKRVLLILAVRRSGLLWRCVNGQQACLTGIPECVILL